MKILSKTGNEAFLSCHKTAFLCSRKTPEALTSVLERWVGGLSADSGCVMCGDQSPMEKLVFSLLLKKGIPAILVLAEAMPDRWDEDISDALAEGRLLVMTHCGPEVHRVCAKSAFDRNMLMLSVADETVVGYCTRGGNLERVLAGFDNVTYLMKASDPDVFGKAEVEKHYATVRNDNNFENNDSWSRRLKLRNGTVSVDFNSTGVETYMKITQSREARPGEYVRDKMFFSRFEFSDFYRAVGRILAAGSAQDAEAAGIVVRSASGDITFAFTDSDCGAAWSFTQSKDFKYMENRRHTVTVCADELSVFYGMLGEAVRHWRL